MLDPDDDGKKRISSARIGLWVVIGGIAVFLLVSGIVGALTTGGH